MVRLYVYVSVRAAGVEDSRHVVGRQAAYGTRVEIEM